MSRDPKLAGSIHVSSWRRVWVAKAHGPLTCADGHHLDDPLVWNEGGLRCKHVARQGQPECGKLVYLVGGGLTTLKGEPLVLLADVTPAEMRAMKHGKMTYEQALAYLGILVPAA